MEYKKTTSHFAYATANTTQTCCITAEKKKEKKQQQATSHIHKHSADRPSAPLFSCGGLKAVKRERFQPLGYSQSSELLQSQRTTVLWRRAAAPNHFRTSLSLLFRQLFPGPTLPLFSPTRLTFYLTAATLMRAAVDGEEVGSSH